MAVPKPDENGVIEDVAAEIGFKAAIKLMVWAGNSTIAIPAEIKEGSWLANVIGIEAARRLASAFGPCSLYVQGMTMIEAERRDKTIAAMIAAGASTKDIAEHVGMSDRLILYRRRSLESRGILPMILNADAGRKWAAKLIGEQQRG